MSIGAALAVAVSSYRTGIAPKTVLALGLVFEVLGSYGIAAARYLDLEQQAMAPPGVSWVAVWILLFATVIPTPPKQALAAALASATAVPVVASLALVLRGDVRRLASRRSRCEPFFPTFSSRSLPPWPRASSTGWAPS